MPTRYSGIDEAAKRARRQVSTAIDEIVLARRTSGLSQAAVARAIGVSRGLVAHWEQGQIVPSLVQLSRWGATVGLDVSLRTFPGDRALRDAGQLRLLERFHRLIGDAWSWRTEVSVSDDPRDRRAFDVVIDRGAQHAAAEAVSRLMDAQAQVRHILAKQAASGIACVILVLADTRHNRVALAAGSATIDPAFPCRPREALLALRAGTLPRANAIVVA